MTSSSIRKLPKIGLAGILGAATIYGIAQAGAAKHQDTNTRRQDTFTFLDTNHDGKVSLEEMVSAKIESLTDTYTRHYANVIDTYDQDGDGTLSKLEMDAMTRAIAAKRDRIRQQLRSQSRAVRHTTPETSKDAQ